ncbi:MAG: hypothetical protein PUJ34_00780, partial [Subdoligranulum sp.]|nr:hypothetical protein [Subdoligranulum sp.]
HRFMFCSIFRLLCTQNGTASFKKRGAAFDLFKGNTAQFPPCGLSTAPAAAARHLRCQNAR